MKSFALSGFLPVIHPAQTPEPFVTAASLVSENVTAVEILYTEAAPDLIAGLKKTYPELSLAAGNVTTAEACRRAVLSGASLIMMPFFLPELVAAALEAGAEPIPTCFTASEVAQAVNLGVETIQLRFSSPSQAFPVLKEYFDLFPQVRYIPAGCVTEQQLPDYIACPAVATVQANWLCTQETTPLQVAENCRRAHKAVMGFELAHVGINCQDLEECQSVAATFGDVFGFPSRDNGNSIYSTDTIEVMKFMQIGSLGHLAIRSNSVERAALELSKKGMTAINSTAKYKYDRLNVIYYNEEIGHFGIHLIQRQVW